MNEGQQNHEHENQLRFTFVAMLFALTIGEVAIKFAQLVNTEVPYYHSAYFHLLLASLIIVTSWVGWVQSRAPGNVRAVKRIYSLEFIILLIDVFLVICYFIIVKGAEVPKSKFDMNASANNETLWMVVVFAGYLLWDFLTKAVIGLQPNQSFWMRVSNSYFLKNLAITFGCLSMAIIILIIVRCLDTLSNFMVIIIDMVLLIIVAIFRLLKQFFGHRYERP